MRQASLADLPAEFAEAVNEVVGNQFGVEAVLYKPTTVVDDDINVYRGAVVAVGKSQVQIQFGDAARDMATKMAVYGKQVAVAFFPECAEPLLFDRGVVKESVSGKVWIVHGRPEAQELGNAVLGVYVLVSRCLPKAVPNGVA